MKRKLNFARQFLTALLFLMGFTTVAQADNVAKIGDTEYSTLQAAFNAATDGQTVTLLANCNGNGIIVPEGKFNTTGLTVDFANFTYTVDGTELAGSTGTKTQAFQLLKDNNITFKNGAIVADNSSVKMLIQNYSNLTLDGMTLDATQGTNSVGYVLSTNNGNTVIKDTKITAKEGGKAFDADSGWGSYPSNTVELTGTSEINGDIEVAFEKQTEGTPSVLKLTSGTLNGNIVLGNNADECTVTKDDTFEAAAPADHKWVSNNDGTSTLRPCEYICAIGETKYETLAEAVAAAGTAETTITLLTEAATDGVISGDGVVVPENSNITFDLNGLTYDVTGETVGSTNTETQGFQLLKNSNITFKNGTLKASAAKAQMVIQNYSNLTLENVNVDGTALSGWAYALSNNSGTVNLTGSTSITAKDGGRAFDTCKFSSYTIPTVNVNTTGAISGPIEATGGKLIIENGKFKVTWVTDSHYTAGDIQIKGGVFSEKPAEEYCAEGIIPTANTDEATKAQYPYTVKVGSYVAAIGEMKYETLQAAVDAAESGATIDILKDFTLTADIACQLESGSFNLLLGDYSITRGEFGVSLNTGVTVKTDKKTDIFVAAEEGYEVVETAVEGGYTYTIEKQMVIPEKPEFTPNFEVKIPSGTYKIKNNVTGNYVNVVGKYYAKAEKSEADASEIGVGVGYKVEDGYRVISLTGTNPQDGSNIEVYNYVAKAYTMAVKLVQEKITNRFSDNFSTTTLEELNAFADSVCAIYIDDYAYVTLVPVEQDGDNYVVRAVATVPNIPNTVKKLGEAIVGMDVWKWAKQQVYKYLDEHSQVDATLKSLVRANLDKITYNTTYFLSADEDGTLGYEVTLEDNTLWIMEPVKTTPDGLTPGEYNIQNVATEKFVDVTDTYYAKVDKTEDDLIMEEIPSTLINVDFGRCSKDNANLYRITELSNQDQDVVAYIQKAGTKANELASQLVPDLRQVLNEKIPASYGVEFTDEELKEDVKVAIDLCMQHYAYLTLVDNGDETVSVYGDVPEVPALLDSVATKVGFTSFMELVINIIDTYFEDSGSNTNIVNLWNSNKGNLKAGTRYYLTADADDTFGYANDNSSDAAKWMLTKVEKSYAGLIDGVDYDEKLAGQEYKKVTYQRTFKNVGVYQPWYVPFNYTIAEDDAKKFTFYRIHMIAGAQVAGEVENSNAVYVYIETLPAGHTLLANRPYIIKVKNELTDYIFTMENTKLEGKDTSSRKHLESSEWKYDFYGNYATADTGDERSMYYLNKNGSIVPNNANAKLGSYRWCIKTTANEGNVDAKPSFFIMEGDGEATGLTSPNVAEGNEIEGIYTINGMQLDALAKGLNIIKYKNGQTKKIIIK